MDIQHNTPLDELQFLTFSNLIEEEDSFEALEDAHQAWIMAKELLTPDGDPIRSMEIKAIHAVLMRRLNPRIAGQFRPFSVRVGNYIAPSHVAVGNLLADLCQREPKTEEEIKQWHIDFEKIHPFEDGNGRTGRIIYNAQRLQNGLPIHIIRPGLDQRKYYAWFFNN